MTNHFFQCHFTRTTKNTFFPSFCTGWSNFVVLHLYLYQYIYICKFISISIFRYISISISIPYTYIYRFLSPSTLLLQTPYMPQNSSRHGRRMFFARIINQTSQFSAKKKSQAKDPKQFGRLEVNVAHTSNNSYGKVTNHRNCGSTTFCIFEITFFLHVVEMWCLPYFLKHFFSFCVAILMGSKKILFIVAGA